MSSHPPTQQPEHGPEPAAAAPVHVGGFGPINTSHDPTHHADTSSIPGTPSSIGSDLPVSSLSSSLFLSETSSPTGLEDIPQRDRDLTSAARTLVIPSLTIPQYNTHEAHDAGRGDAVGNVKLWVIGASLHECQAAAESVIRDAPLVSEVGDWVHFGSGISVLHASTLSSTHHAFPAPLHESKWNVEAYVADVGIDSKADTDATLDSILTEIQTPFVSTDRLLNDGEPSTTSFLPLLTSPSTLLHTALIYLRSPTSTEHDNRLINELSASIPVLVLPSTHTPATVHVQIPTSYASSSTAAPLSSAISSLRPNTLPHLRDILFSNPSTLHHLRTEAAERFLRWRDLNAALRSSMGWNGMGSSGSGSGGLSGSPESPTVHPLDLSWRRGPGERAESVERPAQNRARASSAAATTSLRTPPPPPPLSSSSSYSTAIATPKAIPKLSSPRPPIRSPPRAPLSSSPRTPLALRDVAEEQQQNPQREWMWNWESRFSRDVKDRQEKLSAQQQASSSSSPYAASSSQSHRGGRRSSSSTMPTVRMPLSTITSASESPRSELELEIESGSVFDMDMGSTTAGAGVNADTSTLTSRRAAVGRGTGITTVSSRNRAGTIRSSQAPYARRPLSPPTHDIIGPYDLDGEERFRSVDAELELERRRQAGDAPDRAEDDPLHLRSVARLAVSLIPALLRRYTWGRPRRPSRTRESDAGRGRPRPPVPTRPNGGMSWGMFGLGVSVGVVLSICIVGIGVELTNRVGSWIHYSG